MEHPQPTHNIGRSAHVQWESDLPCAGQRQACSKQMLVIFQEADASNFQDE